LKKEKRAKKSPKWFNDRNEYLDEEYYKSDKDDNVFNNHILCECYNYESISYGFYSDNYFPREECENIYCRLKYKQIQTQTQIQKMKKEQEEQNIFLKTYKGCQTLDECINDLENKLKLYELKLNKLSYHNNHYCYILIKMNEDIRYLEKLIDMHNSIIFTKLVNESRRSGYIPKRLRGKRYTSNMKNRYMPFEEQRLNLDCVKYITGFIY
jgi:hypothetical protein